MEVASAALTTVGTAVGQAVQAAFFARIKTYMNHVKNCDKNLMSLLENLENLQVEKGDIDEKVLNGGRKDNLVKITGKAVRWLARVRDFTKDETMRKLMKKDMAIAKVMLRLMKDDLRKLVEKDIEMRDIVLKVMKDVAKIKRNVCNREVSDAERKDKEVGEVLEKLIEETMEEFKTLMQNDMNMAVAALHLLENDSDNLERLMEKDKEVADIIAKARETSIIEEELISNDSHDDVLAHENALREKVTNLLKPVREVILNEEFLKALPENIRLGMEVMGVVMGNSRGLKTGLMDAGNTVSHIDCCCCMISYNCLCDRHDTSVAAEAMLDKIKEILGTKPGSQDVTRPVRRGEMEGIPTNCVGLKSRNELLQKIIKALASNDVHAVGIFGMGGSGKTTLAQEVAYRKVNGIFDTTVMVEISESPNIEFIQDQIGNGLDLKLHNVHGTREKAIRLYNKMKSGDSKKILVILDNIWHKIDLLQIGISLDYCKVLLTSREKNVCKAMDVVEANLFEVGLLNENEAKDLFQFQVQKKVHIGEYKSLANRLLQKCKGLPLAIVATANSLKGKGLPFWRQFAEELEKPISCQISGVHHETFSILRTSYEFMASEEKKKFFLMACLSPLGSFISIDNLMRYGIGLDLFRNVNKLSEAIDLARTWAEELVSSSMFLKGYSDEYVKIHDVVRESTMSFALKTGINSDRQMFLVDAIPRWIGDEFFNKYTGISLLAQPNFGRLSGVKADLLQILLFKGNRDDDSFLESIFFQGMTNLRVLEVSLMNFEEGLPKSMGELKVLKTLHLVKCKLGDIKLIGELGSLLVLSLRGSSLQDGLPDEIGNLYNLRLLDMRKCKCKEPIIPGNVIARLSLLEGLYLGDSNLTQWAVTESTSNDTAVTNGADMDEFNNLEFLNVLEMRILGPKSLPIRAQFVKNLDKFQIIVGEESFILQPSQRVLMVSKFDVSEGLKKDNCLKALLKKADFLDLERATVNNIVPELDEEGFRHLSRLELSYIDNITRMCEGKAPTELFYNLCHLKVLNLEQLEALFPVNPLPRKMTTLNISDCNSLTYIFSEDDDGVNKESDIIELPCLKTLVLNGVRNLTSVVKQSNSDDNRYPSFFNSKVTLTSLEELFLKYNKRIVKLWDKESNMHGFQNLKVLKIIGCEEMEAIGPPSMFLSLVQLEVLLIQECKEMQQVIDYGSETQEIPKEEVIITFPKLKKLLIYEMDNLECFYGGSYKMAFPHLKDLRLNGLIRMTKFAGGVSSTTFFPKTIEFPCLELLRLKMVSDEVSVLWDLHEGQGQGFSSNNPLPNLKKLTVGKLKLPSIVFPSLSLLRIELVGDANFLFSSSSENEGCLGTFSQFRELEELIIEGCPGSDVKQFIQDDGSTAMLNFCGQLRTLTLQSAPNMEVLSLHLFKNLHDLYISGVTLEYIFSADGGLQQLQLLEQLTISKCPNLEVIIRGGDKDTIVVFPRLKMLYLGNLECMSKLCSISDIPLHFPSLKLLRVHSCNKLESLFFGEPNQVVELPSLEEVLIKDCDAMKSFSTGPLKSTKLRELTVFNCSEMEWFLLGNSNCNADLELPSLEYVAVEKCPNMKSLLSALLRAPRLKELSVAECNKWEWLFDGQPNQVVELPSLEQVIIMDCDAMKSFSTGPLKVPKLRKLWVSRCPDMVWFLLGNSNCNADLELPSLEKIFIKKCPNMISFSPAVLRAPKLQLLKVDDKPYPIAEIEDFNHVLQSANRSEQTHAADKNDW